KKNHTFHRTPKFNIKPGPQGGWSRTPARALLPMAGKPQILFEITLSLYALAGVAVALLRHSIGSLPFLILCTVSLGYTAAQSLNDLMQEKNLLEKA
ncbi:MAG: hypothetical protein JXA42_07995, partial [Anaerolineales bacterium]|nr:hypothetical protein [Anaerolineales bacterium]